MAGPDSPASVTRPLGVAILAGGRARRMQGLDKSTLDVAGTSIIDRQLAVLREVADELRIVAADPPAYARYGVPVSADLEPGFGPLGGLYTALHLSTVPHTFVVACDMPFVSRALVERLAALAAPDVDVVVPRTRDGSHPLCAVYARSVLSAVRRRMDRGALALKGLLEDVRVAELGPEEMTRLDPDGILLFNVNTPHDYREACSRALVR